MFDLNLHKKIQAGVDIISSNDECKILSIAQAKTLVIDKDEYINNYEEDLYYAIEICRYFNIKPKCRFDYLKISNKFNIYHSN